MTTAISSNLPTVADLAAKAETKTDDARSKLSGSFDTFLQLLTAQLRNQDPTNPLDSSQFTQQLVQYSQVEQQIETNDQLKSLLGSQTAATTNAALGFLGRTVTVEAAETSLTDQGAQWTYTLPKSAKEATVIVRDASGKEIGRAPAERAAGSHIFDWDGRNSRGERMADGVYTLSVSAIDNDDQAIKAAIQVQTKVASVETGPDGIQLVTPIGRKAMESVIAIRD